jgi:hypothetical protein
MLLVFVAAATFAQTPPATPEKSPPQSSAQAPPEVDAALRARITQFYQFEVDGKYNQALQLVAEDTKDLFVGSSKPTYQSFTIQSIRYSGDFTTAEVMLMVNRLLPIQGFMGHPIPTKMTSRWKLENGQWCFYVDPQRDLPSTPFGAFAPPGMGLPSGGTPGPSGTPRPLPPMPATPANPSLLIAEKSSVQLKASGPSSAQVAFSNPTTWNIGIALSDPKVAGLTVKLDTLMVRPGQRAILSIQSSGVVQTPKTPITIMLTVKQTNQRIPIKVSFAD